MGHDPLEPDSSSFSEFLFKLGDLSDAFKRQVKETLVVPDDSSPTKTVQLRALPEGYRPFLYALKEKAAEKETAIFGHPGCLSLGSDGRFFSFSEFQPHFVWLLRVADNQSSDYADCPCRPCQKYVAQLKQLYHRFTRPRLNLAPDGSIPTPVHFRVTEIVWVPCVVAESGAVTCVDASLPHDMLWPAEILERDVDKVQSNQTSAIPRFRINYLVQLLRQNTSAWVEQELILPFLCKRPDYDKDLVYLDIHVSSQIKACVALSYRGAVEEAITLSNSYSCIYRIENPQRTKLSRLSVLPLADAIYIRHRESCAQYRAVCLGNEVVQIGDIVRIRQGARRITSVKDSKRDFDLRMEEKTLATKSITDDSESVRVMIVEHIIRNESPDSEQVFVQGNVYEMSTRFVVSLDGTTSPFNFNTPKTYTVMPTWTQIHFNNYRGGLMYNIKDVYGRFYPIKTRRVKTLSADASQFWMSYSYDSEWQVAPVRSDRGDDMSNSMMLGGSAELEIDIGDDDVIEAIENIRSGKPSVIKLRLRSNRANERPLVPDEPSELPWRKRTISDDSNGSVNSQKMKKKSKIIIQSSDEEDADDDVIMFGNDDNDEYIDEEDMDHSTRDGLEKEKKEVYVPPMTIPSKPKTTVPDGKSKSNGSMKVSTKTIAALTRLLEDEKDALFKIRNYHFDDGKLVASDRMKRLERIKQSDILLSSLGIQKPMVEPPTPEESELLYTIHLNTKQVFERVNKLDAWHGLSPLVGRGIGSFISITEYKRRVLALISAEKWKENELKVLDGKTEELQGKKANVLVPITNGNEVSEKKKKEKKENLPLVPIADQNETLVYPSPEMRKGLKDEEMMFELSINGATKKCPLGIFVFSKTSLNAADKGKPIMGLLHSLSPLPVKLMRVPEGKPNLTSLIDHDSIYDPNSEISLDKNSRPFLVICKRSRSLELIKNATPQSYSVMKLDELNGVLENGNVIGFVSVPGFQAVLASTPKGITHLLCVTKNRIEQVIPRCAEYLASELL